MSKSTAKLTLLALGVICLLFTGCGKKRPFPIAKCSGTATFQSRPITNMTITMNQGSQGRPSRSALSESGEFDMSYSFREKGVQVGKNFVNFLWTEPTQPPKHVQEVLDYMKKSGPLEITISEDVDDLELRIP